MKVDMRSREKSIKNLDKIAYKGNDLGASYTKDETVFKVWAPTADKVELNLYDTGAKGSGRLINRIQMEYQKSEGIWSLVQSGDLKGVFYTYLVHVNGQVNETADIYAKAVGVSGDRGMVVDLDATNPVGFDKDLHVFQEQSTDAIIWEVHVQDFSSHANSGVSEKNRGKYLAFTEENTTLNNEGKIPTCMNYLKELGVNYIHLLPIADRDNDELQDLAEGKFNWGYDPKNYNVPEGVYSTNPSDGECRIREFKQMVMSIHNAGIGVVMDVVYNHTARTEDSWFNMTVPDYYYRQDSEGRFLNGSHCGNETASERIMFRKFIVDSILYWAREYHIDGFRFDLMGLHDVATMNLIRESLNDAGLSKVILYGEPWDAGSNGMHGEVLPANKQNIAHLKPGIAIFNDDFRDSVKGHVFYDKSAAFVQGKNVEHPADISQSGREYCDGDLMAAIQANSIEESAKKSKWANVPWARDSSQSVAYVSAHDNLTLWDKLIISTTDHPKDTDFLNKNENVLSMNKLAATALFTSMGLVFFHAGEEFARTKLGDENSYCSSVEVNQLDWSNLERFKELNEYYKGLIKLRKMFASLKHKNGNIKENMSFLECKCQNLIAYTIQFENGEYTRVAAVILNSNSSSKTVEMKLDTKRKENSTKDSELGRAADGYHVNKLPRKWNVIVDKNLAGIEPLRQIEGNMIEVPCRSAMILIDAEC